MDGMSGGTPPTRVFCSGHSLGAGLVSMQTSCACFTYVSPPCPGPSIYGLYRAGACCSTLKARPGDCSHVRALDQGMTSHTRPGRDALFVYVPP